MLARVREKHLDRWLPGYLRHTLAEAIAPPFKGHRHVLLAICDHYEPRWQQPTAEVAESRVQRWRGDYPKLAAEFRDADGRPPRHSFFFPGEEYAPSYLDALAELARAGLGEVELHLHHDGATEAGAREEIERYLRLYAEHGHLSREDGRLRYAFIHGNWCLANARRDGRWCGVDRELPLLFETGCYADFTFPAAPDESQPGIVNQIYWPDGELGRRRAYEQGRRARVGQLLHDRVLMIQGPLGVTLHADRRRPIGIENADLTGKNPATVARVRAWVRQNIHITGRPEWVFVKLHTHGAQEANMESLLGEGGRTLHRLLAAELNDGDSWSLHYVTAREMYNVACAAMDGKFGQPSDYFDYRLKPPPAAG